MRADWPFSELSRCLCFPAIPSEKNLVYLAVELFRSTTGFSANLAVELIKRIPPGSGLGGGSSDAAAALLALNSLTFPSLNEKVPLSREALIGLAAQLGSDVPFFVQIAYPGESPACLVTGRGEFLTPLPPPPPLGILLAFPGFASETGSAYALLDTCGKPPAEIRQGALCCHSSTKCASSLGIDVSWPILEAWNWGNDFLELFLNHGTEQEKKAYNAILKDLRAAGAVFTGLSGSGSTCFGIFNSIQAAERARKSLSGSFFTLQTTFFLRS
jgi:4-diphosphocytidyl-2-C-methyl-D-erythritol kinase